MTPLLDEIRAALGRQLPRYQVRSIEKLGGGLDHAVYEVNGELVVRTSTEDDPATRSEATRRDADLLAAVAEFATLPTPELVFADVEAGVHAYRTLAGASLLEHPVTQPARLAPALGEFLSHLHRAPVEAMETLVPRDTYPLPSWQRDAQQEYQAIADAIPAEDRPLVEDFLGSSPPAEPSAAAFCHNDLGAEHILVNVESHQITGIIDWSDAAITDPVRDLALVYRDLGPDIFDRTLDYYQGVLDDAHRKRAAFYARCALLEDLAYGLHTGRRRYAEAALAHLAWTFT